MRTIALAVLCAALAIPAAAQDTARPRDPDKPKTQRPRTTKERDRSKQPKPATPQAAPRSEPRQERPQAEAQRRRPRPEADARSRHPRPDGWTREYNRDRYWRERRFGWEFYQGFDWYYQYPHRRYRFPFSYRDRDKLFELRLYFGGHFGPHSHLYYPKDHFWFYWPWYDPPPRGCGWYTVPVRREPIFEPGYGWYWDYWDWRDVYVCFR